MQPSTGITLWDNLPSQLSWSDKVALLTYRFMQREQEETGLHHLFQDDLYIREVRIPAGTLIVGRIHKIGHEMELLKGQVILIGPDGFSHGVQAPEKVHTGPGFQMVCFTLSDVIARTIHPNADQNRDIAELEAEFFEDPAKLIERGEQIERKLLT